MLPPSREQQNCFADDDHVIRLKGREQTSIQTSSRDRFVNCYFQGQEFSVKLNRKSRLTLFYVATSPLKVFTLKSRQQQEPDTDACQLQKLGDLGDQQFFFLCCCLSRQQKYKLYSASQGARSIFRWKTATIEFHASLCTFQI